MDCLFCLRPCPDQVQPHLGLNPPGAVGSPVLAGELQSFFILRKILDLGDSWFEAALATENSSQGDDHSNKRGSSRDLMSSWFRACQDCSAQVHRAWDLHQEMINLQTRMTEVKSRLKEGLRTAVESRRATSVSDTSSKAEAIRRAVYSSCKKSSITSPVLTAFPEPVVVKREIHEYHQSHDLDLNLSTPGAPYNDEGDLSSEPIFDSIEPHSPLAFTFDGDFDFDEPNLAPTPLKLETELDTGIDVHSPPSNAGKRTRLSKQSHIKTDSANKSPFAKANKRNRKRTLFTRPKIRGQISNLRKSSSKKAETISVTRNESSKNEPQNEPENSKPSQEKQSVTKVPKVRKARRTRKAPETKTGEPKLKEEEGVEESAVPPTKPKRARAPPRPPPPEGYFYSNRDGSLKKKMRAFCYLCRVFVKREELKKHQRLHKERQMKKNIGHPLTCKECTYPARSEEELQKHWNWRHKKRKWEREKQPEKIWYCPALGCSYSNRVHTQLKRHASQAHPNLTEASLSGHPEKLTLYSELILRCPHCSQQFPNRFHYTTHLKSKVKTCRPAPFICEICGATYTVYSSFWHHVKGKHPATPRPEVRHQCSICGCDYSKRQQLNRHMQKCHSEGKEEELIKCKYCDLTSTSLPVILRHEKKHLQEEGVGHKCLQCERSYFSDMALKRHIRINHPKVKVEVPCPYCGKKYTARDYMLRHVANACKAKGGSGGKTEAAEGNTEGMSKREVGEEVLGKEELPAF